MIAGTEDMPTTLCRILSATSVQRRKSSVFMNGTAAQPLHAYGAQSKNRPQLIMRGEGTVEMRRHREAGKRSFVSGQSEKGWVHADRHATAGQQETSAHTEKGGGGRKERENDWEPGGTENVSHIAQLDNTSMLQDASTAQ